MPGEEQRTAHGHGDAGHGHGHGHGHGGGSVERLRAALVLTASFFVVEVVAGFYTHSLSLLSDAGHMLTDSGALVLALIAQRIAGRPRTRGHTFGFRRAEILAALINGLVLCVMGAAVLVEAIHRIGAPPEIRGVPMLVVAVLGLFVNLGAAFILSRGGASQNANVRAAMAHVVADAAGSVASIVAATFVVTIGYDGADAIASIAIAVLILAGATRLVKGTLQVLMEGVPAGIDLAELERVVRETPGVSQAHDLHAWAISDGFVAVTVHVVLDGESHGTDVARAVRERIREHFGIEHVTVQPEAPTPDELLISADRVLARTREVQSTR